MPDITFLAHNHRVYAAPCDPQPAQGVVGYRPRGWVGGFSKFSKARLASLVYSFEKMPFKSFWTLTFERDVNAEECKRELNRILTIFRQAGAQYLWIMEFTEKGRVHFHVGLTRHLAKTWVHARWHNGFVYASKIYDDGGMRWYFLKEIAKGNQKRFMGFWGRWWGVSRVLNKQYSLGVYDESFLHALVGEKGFKRCYWRRDLEGIVDNPYAGYDTISQVRKISRTRTKQNANGNPRSVKHACLGLTPPAESVGGEVQGADSLPGKIRQKGRKSRVQISVVP